MRVLAQGSPRRIESRQNARVKALRAGLTQGVPGPAGQVAVEGLHLVEEAQRSGLHLHTVFVREGSEPLLQPLDLDHAEVLILPADVFRSATLTDTPQGIAALIAMPAFTLEAMLGEQALIVVVANLQDPGNLGTLMRSAEAFGATGIILLTGTVSVWNGKTLRASSGSAFRLPSVMMSSEDAFSTLKQHGVRIHATVARGGEAFTDLRPASALVIGNEAAGLPQAWIDQADARVTIPCPGPVESLNAGVAGSVLLYEAMRQRRIPQVSA